MRSLRVASALALLLVAALLCGCHGDADMTQTGPGEVKRIADVEAFEARLAAPTFQNASPRPRADYPPRPWHIHALATNVAGRHLAIGQRLGRPFYIDEHRRGGVDSRGRHSVP